jgi:hypothetical protein
VPLEALCLRLADAIPELLAERGFRKDTCILATRLTCLALQSERIRCRPFPVKITASNAAYIRFVRERERLPLQTDPPEIVGNAWSVFVGPGNELFPKPNGRRGWSGNLVALIGEKYIVDGTIGQAARPDREIHLPEGAWFPAPDYFLRGEHGIVTELDGGGVLTYHPLEDRAFRAAPDWTRVRPSDPLVAQLLERVADA